MKFIFSSASRTAAFGLLLTATASCDLLQQQSPQDFNPNDVFSTPARIDKAAVGMYDALQDGEFLGSRALVYADVRSDDVELSPAFNNLAISNIPSSDGSALGAWAGGYRSMYMANYMIRELTKRNGAGLDVAKYNQYIGEAKFIRALCHFTLVNLFAQPYNATPDASHLGVPIQLTAPDGTEAYEPAQQLPRSTVKEVYEQIIKDLTEAIAVLPETQSAGGGNDNAARATKDAARGLLSRVYLYKGEYGNVIRTAEPIIGSGLHRLNSSAFADFLVPAEGTPNLTSESIFFIAMSQNDNPNTNAAIGQYYTPSTTISVSVTPYKNALPGPAGAAGATAANTDRRRLDQLRFTSSQWWTRKYSKLLLNGSPGGANMGAWIPIVRYPEILLNQAEALVKNAPTFPYPATDSTALRYLNYIRNRSKPTNAPAYTLSSFTTKEAFINAILTERRFELAFEGHRLYDLFRNGLNVPAHGTAPNIIPELPWKSTKAILPIPSSEITRNPKLVQNDAY
ncbi:RagB/SusD family nutrient uptake outer membrane protein [Hymenobacter jeollabukensis]|uniref:RagB/SusD family nutrient uptake outer membrane protein n=1 Tax=Hymenobacter jeollabukensis TaxID=2025313 RepID=A0A5R8WQP9_9BACT|nr:RagB/SusD family nutrient uptake outer membrane protein [Hymenobacter jeollabukensis]TLM92429.1 RagB/SusD family nutrient uptake outer membrane protein [Hymenobacter jeollabukensis]